MEMTWEILDDTGYLAWDEFQPHSLILKTVVGQWCDVQEETSLDYLIPATPWQLYKSDVCYRNIRGVWFKYTRQPVTPEMYGEEGEQ